MSDLFAGKKVLVTGGTGMIGRPLVGLLLDRGAKVRVTSMDSGENLPPEVEFSRLDLTLWENCKTACRGIDIVFHLSGIKGGVGVGRAQAAKFLEVNSLMNFHMLKAAYEAGAGRYLFTSSVGVYPDTDIFREGEVWDKPPHRSDWYGAWSKRMGELQCEAYLEQYQYKTCIVRPATIYGPFDNFDPKTAMVAPALIHRVVSGEDPLVVWGDGSAQRDFIYSEDCARGMMMVMENYYECDPINLGSGVPVTIKQVVDVIVKLAPKPPKVVWDTSKPTGNKIRLMDMSKAKEKAGFKAQISLEEGIRRTMEWYLKNKEYQAKRFKVFTA